MNESSVGWTSPVETEQGDHGLLLTRRAAVRIVAKISADLFPVFLFYFLILAVELFMNQGKRFLFAFTTQDSVVL